MTADVLSHSHDGNAGSGLAGRHFNLLRSFALLSFVVIFTSGTISATFISDFLAKNLLARDAADLQHFLQSIFNTKGDLNLSVVPPVDLNPANPFDLSYIAAMPDVLRVNFYTPEWRVAWSTSRELVGKRFSDNHELDRALRGQLVFEVQKLNEGIKAEHIQFDANNHAVENYLPIWDRDHRRVIGVVEIYRSPTDLFDTIEEGRKLVWTGAMLAGLLLYISLFWIVFRANRLIHHQHEKLVEAETMAAVGEMASAVAHSIRNPLAAIRSSAELSLETSADAGAREIAEDVIAEADRLAQWVRELLIFAQPGSGNFQPTQLKAVLDECLTGFSRCMQRQGVQLDIELEALAEINGDVRLLAQMFNSLFANALEAMSEGGRLTVRGAHADEGRTVHISISDSGYGIPRERLDRIFEMRSTTKRGGLGIGMTLVKRIADRHGAHITITSDIGKGTTVHLRFPTEAHP